jgi:hypothetical protein
MLQVIKIKENITMTKIIWRNALLVGIICAVIEAVLVWGTDPAIDPWLLAQGVLFWLGAGMLVYMADSGLSSLLHGISLTVLLNLPWYIALAIAPGQWALLPPLIIASVILGCLIGWLRGKLNRSAASNVLPLVLENVKS